MQVKYKRKDTKATTQYVRIKKDIQNKILDDMSNWIVDWIENYDNTTNPYRNIIFNPDPKMPKLGTGNDRSRGIGHNSIYSYIEGIVANHRFKRNPETDELTRDFTVENLKWIGIVSSVMRAIDPDTYTEFEFVDEDKWVNPATKLFGT